MSGRPSRWAGSRFASARRELCENGNSDETRSSPCDRVGSENPDLIAARTEGSKVIDGGLQRAARKRGRHGTTTRVNLELAIRRGCLGLRVMPSTSPSEERPSAHHPRVARTRLPSLGPVRECPSTSIPRQPRAPDPAHPASPQKTGCCRAESGPFPPYPHHRRRRRKVILSRARFTRLRDDTGLALVRAHEDSAGCSAVPPSPLKPLRGEPSISSDRHTRQRESAV